MAKDSLEKKNDRLAELYETAHQFVDHVSHEFRTPLTVIKEFTSIMRDGLAGEITDDQREYLGIVINRVDDLSVMVDDMLDISKLEAGLLGVCRNDVSVTSIVERVRSTLERKAAALEVSLEISVNPDLPQVYCDPEKIGRVLINLVVNGLKFCGENGTVRVHAVDQPEQSQVLISVVDDGPGISPEYLQAIFERFRQIDGNVRASTKGFGLGLNIAKELVQLNFGDMMVESELRQGSTFSFTIPTSDRPALVRRYLDRLKKLRNGSSHVSILTCAVHTRGSDELMEDVDLLLRRQARRNDLVFRMKPDRWVLLVASEQTELESLIERLNKVRDTENRNRPGDALPVIDFEQHGGWKVADGRDELIQRCTSVLQPDEVIHA